MDGRLRLKTQNSPGKETVGYEAIPTNSSGSEEHPVPGVRAPYFPARVLVYIAAYLFVGAVAYRHLEGINYLEGLYLSVITFTTVGFGDLAPKDDRGRVFTCFFIALALLGVAQLVDIVFDFLVEERKVVEKKAIFRSWFHEEEEEELEEGDGGEGGENGVPRALDDDGEEDEALVKAARQNAQQWELIRSFASSATSMLGVIFVGVLFYSYVVDDFNLIESFYLATMTVTTVGYGDVVPRTDESRLFTGFYAVFGTIAFGRAVGYFIETLGAQRELDKHEKLLSASALDYDTWKSANSDGTDRVTRVEFVYMRLLQMGLIDEHVRKKIEEQFDRMDRNHDGDLTIEDIVKAQEFSVRSSKKKQLIRSGHYYSNNEKK
jgi:potassium channel subfamily K